MLDDPSNASIIDGIIGLADSFRREVIAEDVETIDVTSYEVWGGKAMA